MCQECRRDPCDPRCPNYVCNSIRHCSECGGEVWEEMKYYRSDNGLICEECLNSMSAKEIIELTGGRLEVA